MLKKILLVFVSILAVAACAQGIKSIEQNKQVNKTPSQVVKEFYHWYISGNEIFYSLQYQNKVYDYVSKDLITKIKKAIDYGEYDVPANLAEYMDGADYFLKVQDFEMDTALKTFKVLKEEIKNDKAYVKIQYIPITNIHNFVITLQKEKNGWRIIKVKELDN